MPINIHDYPAISDLERRAKRRMPHFAWEYLASGTGEDAAITRNRNALDAITMLPRILQGPYKPSLETVFLGQSYAMPIGMAPIGGTSVIWPGAEAAMALVASEARVPVGLSTVATRTPEEIGPLAGDFGWFQLYPLGADGAQEDILRRARDAGYKTLVLTVDVPINSRRERQRRAGFNVPPKLTPRFIAQALAKPNWLIETLRNGTPRARLLEDYAPSTSVADVAKRLGPEMRPNPDWSIISHLRSIWEGPFVVKGVTRPDDAVRLSKEGVDAVWVSTHGGRQFDAAPGAATLLPAIRNAVGADYPLIYDSGIASGLDAARALALGADFVMAGRAFLYGMGAFGQEGVAHALRILRADLENVLGQLGLNEVGDLKDTGIYQAEF